jgi:hypothetical protein
MGDMRGVNMLLSRYDNMFPSRFFSPSYPLGIVLNTHGLEDRTSLDKRFIGYNTCKNHGNDKLTQDIVQDKRTC